VNTDLQTISIGDIGPFPPCSADLSSAYDTSLSLLAQNYRDRMRPNARAALIILVGSADNQRLAPHCLARFATNDQLAMARAIRVRTELERRLSGENPQPRYVLLSAGPRHLEAKDREQDRAVDAWVAVATN
jgi:flagellar motor protein MotB